MDKRQLSAILELQNRIEVGTAIARAAAPSPEGSHSREKFPAFNPERQKMPLLRHQMGEFKAKK